ncbi:hypothetical protein VII00023_00290, partial [Vibrio ichthyoenteri ATCC 700023]
MSSLKKSTSVIISAVVIGLLCAAYWKYQSLVLSITFEDPNFKACVLEGGNEIEKIEHLE